MSFDNLITIGIIIYVIYSIKKVFSSGQKDGATREKSSGWAGKLGDFINDIKTEIERANQEAMKGQSAGGENVDEDFWEDIRQPSSAKPQEDSRTISQTLFYETEEKKAPSAVEEVPELPEIPEESHRNDHGTHDKPAPIPVRSRSCSQYLDMKKSDLKKAVIWSEILSKPISLKD